MMKVIGLMSGGGNSAYYNREFRNNVEMHLDHLRANATMIPMTISEQLAYKYEGDFYGALTELKVPAQLHWVVLRLNGMTSPTELRSRAGTIMVPEPAEIARLINMLNTKK